MQKNENFLKVLKAIGENFKTQRLKKNLTLKDLSIKAGIRQPYLVKIEKGQAFRINADHIYLLAQALEIRPYDLVCNIK